MSKEVFRSHNKVGETMSFQTNITSGSTFDPKSSVINHLNNGRVSWDLGDGNGYIATNSDLSHIFSGDTGTTKTITLRTTKLSHLTQFYADNDNLVGHLDMSGWDNLAYGIAPGLDVQDNPGLTAITNTYSPHEFYAYSIKHCDITGYLDLTMFPGGITYCYLEGNPKLSGVTFTATSHNMARLFIHDCDLQGHLDVSMFSDFPNYFSTLNNSGLTGVTFPTAPNDNNGILYFYLGPSIVGVLDVSFTNFGGDFIVNSNPNLNKIIHGPSSDVFNNYWAHLCNLTGNLDLSMLTGLGGDFIIRGNPSLTGVTHTASTQNFNNYWAQDCDLGYINFLPLSGVSMDLSIKLQNNDMTATDVNHILVDFDTMSTNLNPTGWSGVTLDISGTNATPDSVSGSYDGLTALGSLTGITNNWTITTS